MFKFIFILILIYPKIAFAYIDPGIGSLIIQSIIAGIAMGFGLISIYWNKTKDFLKNLTKNFKSKKKDE